MEKLSHECGIAMIRLLKPLEYYQAKYGSERWTMNKLYLMMEKQHNRGQEGAGIACVKLASEAGHEYMFREKAEGKDAITTIFQKAVSHMTTPDKDDPEGSKPFLGELYMGHLRYSTTSRSGLKYVHPFLRRNNWRAKNLCLCGNFNMTNIDDVFTYLTSLGQYPRVYADTYIMLEMMGHRLDREVERLYRMAVQQGLQGMDITDFIDRHVDVGNVLQTTMSRFDGGYVVCGLTGSGEMFSMRDPSGIRPAFYYQDDEVVAIASERPVLQTTFAVECEDIHELGAGEAIIVHQDASVEKRQILPRVKNSACSFERIYFSRGNDKDIYLERKRLGALLCDRILDAVDHDVQNTVVSYIPNTAEIAYCGMVEELNRRFGRVRSDKVVSKDIKLRTFITEDSSRNDLAAHVYDITYGSIVPYQDNLVVIDDSIVRGTTLRESIIKILARLHPRKIVVVSSAPQIRYPDFYGIDMRRIGDFIAFQACIALLRNDGREEMLRQVYDECKALSQMPLDSLDPAKVANPVRQLYDLYTPLQIEAKMAEMLRPDGVDIPISFVFQSIEGLHAAIPNHPGDWYFTGNYPTPGGLRLMLRSYCEYFESLIS